ncbi:MAG: SDR family oxidoreductase [Phycisphaerales bacterium]
MELQGGTAIITGASSGIGEGVAKELAGAGMKLVITARRGKLLEKLAEQLNTEVVCVDGDIADPRLPAVLIDTAVKRFGAVDVVFNNAGVMIVGDVAKIDLEAACAMVRVNVEAVYRLGVLAMRQFIKQKRGHLINVSSTLGLKVRPTAELYAGTKFAVEAFSEGLHMQAAALPGCIKVSALEPGLTETHLQDKFEVHPAKAMGIKKMPTPADLARAVRFMLEQPDHVNVPRLMMQPTEQAM